MKNKFQNIRRDANKWSIFLLIIVLFVAIPILTVFINLFYGPGETWGHFLEHLLPNYLKNSLILIIGTSILTLFFGISSAWIVSRYHVPFRKQLEWLLIIPLAIPSYITAYAYAGIFDYGGIVAKVFSLKIDVMNHAGLIFVLSISLYPYIYVASRAFFLNQSNNIIEASKLLGASERKTFFKLILPLARPAFAGGLVLVLMEVLNDYGAAKYYGISTFTTGIFRAWFSLEEPETAIYLSAILVIIIFLLITAEKWQRRKIGYFNATKNHQKVTRETVSKRLRITFFMIAFTPVLFGFLLPFMQLLYWAFLTYKEVFTSEFITIAFQSFGIATISAFTTVVFALLLIFLSKWNRLSILKSIAKIGVLGYAIPGAVIAVGVLIPTLSLDKWLVTFMKTNFDIKIGFIINGTIMVLVYAYLVRFLAVAYNPIESNSLKFGKSLSEASKLLGSGTLKTFIKIEFPLLKPAILSAFILVFVDVMKELPLTLILKPYHINTLAVKAYEYASDELIAEAALPAICIILTGILPILFLNRLIAKDS
ncbi:iron ABC transporter permease [Tenacibaculum finnmarkense]|uniref:ABC transporter permease n=1 Tax=Tenacibaculum finnmarkense TaxID=2781243 RepID=UPI000C5F38B0|nr:iron ABC transporter permease [Tenacibaculum finnmarkense]MCD8404725.1 iron ABC transporter permease [Tenacibaculum dicentrarchi]MCD8402955.1 iron ABC transporter permease [Tenacibaculum finnmarkense genomovar finnmarkense]MCD8412868.1 iron ABC transporter permease [Tenacibaculum finnmarkense genomovar ulcerans]MCD8415057.1 iron ABC transporter permease [Tenacibaculum dicentrarchi]MCD8416861.1 iron ABC transporter permease [Tenacibaculum finnmarkense genomovar finnmarkense]